MGWFMGIASPDPSVIGALLVGAYRGLFYGSPWLVAGVPGLVVLARRGFRAEAITGGAIVLAYLLLNAGLVDWHGGWAMGPRYLIPAIPFLALGAMGLVLAWPPGSPARRAVAWTCGAAAAVSIALMLMGTAVRPDVPLTIARPFTQFVIPSFWHGRVARSNHPIDGEGVSGVRAAWNLGHLVGLDRLATPPAPGGMDGAHRLVAGARGARGRRGTPASALLLLAPVRLDLTIVPERPGRRVAGRERLANGLVDLRLLVLATGARTHLLAPLVPPGPRFFFFPSIGSPASSPIQPREGSLVAKGLDGIERGRPARGMEGVYDWRGGVTNGSRPRHRPRPGRASVRRPDTRFRAGTRTTIDSSLRVRSSLSCGLRP